MTKEIWLQSKYKNAIMAYIKAFEIKQDVDCEPCNVDMLYFDCQNFCLSFHDIKYDIDNNVKKGTIFAYYESYCRNLITVNYSHYVKWGANVK
jgi:hypothetical protein